jgi:nucleoside-diphosphate-sugar epimerase
MSVLVTGGTGFALSNFVRHLLDTEPDTTIVVLDIAPFEGVVTQFLDIENERLVPVQGDVRDRAVLEGIASEHHITHIVHAATLTHLPEWERHRPARYVDVNVMGTVNMLEWARTVDSLKRFVYVSSGGVYGSPTKWSPEDVQPETGPFDPPELYAVTKYTAELIVRRYGQIFELDTGRVRFADVFGPMERPTPGRAKMSAPFHMVRSVIEDRALQVSPGTLQAGGDFLSAEDIASALKQVLLADSLRHDAYNIAFGSYTMAPELFNTFETVAPGFKYEESEAAHADVTMDPTKRLARWNAYSIERITSEFEWRPRPLSEQLASYYEWVMEDPQVRCPELPPSPSLGV